MSGNKGSKFFALLKWVALLGSFVIIYNMGQLIALAVAGSAVYLAWQIMKGAPWDRAAVMPAGLWGGAFGIDNVLQGQSAGPVEAVIAIVGFAVVAIFLIWALKFAVGKLFR